MCTTAPTCGGPRPAGTPQSPAAARPPTRPLCPPPPCRPRAARSARFERCCNDDRCWFRFKAACARARPRIPQASRGGIDARNTSAPQAAPSWLLRAARTTHRFDDPLAPLGGRCARRAPEDGRQRVPRLRGRGRCGERELERGGRPLSRVCGGRRRCMHANPHMWHMACLLAEFGVCHISLRTHIGFKSRCLLRQGCLQALELARHSQVICRRRQRRRRLGRVRLAAGVPARRPPRAAGRLQRLPAGARKRQGGCRSSLSETRTG